MIILVYQKGTYIDPNTKAHALLDIYIQMIYVYIFVQELHVHVCTCIFLKEVT